MQAERLFFLEQAYLEDKSDPFTIYALALEYLKIQPEKSLAYFEDLLENHKAYLPTYYQAAQLYFDLGKYELCKHTYIKGIALADKLQNAKTKKELIAAYQLFIDETEEDA